MLDSLFRFQDAATACGDLANQLLTTVLDGYGPMSAPLLPARPHRVLRHV